MRAATNNLLSKATVFIAVILLVFTTVLPAFAQPKDRSSVIHTVAVGNANDEMVRVTESPTEPVSTQNSDSGKSGFLIGLGALALGGIVAGAILFLKRKKDDGEDDSC